MTSHKLSELFTLNPIPLSTSVSIHARSGVDLTNEGNTLVVAEHQGKESWIPEDHGAELPSSPATLHHDLKAIMGEIRINRTFLFGSSFPKDQNEINI